MTEQNLNQPYNPNNQLNYQLGNQFANNMRNY